MPQDVYTHGHDDAVLRSHRWRTVANSAAYLRPHLRDLGRRSGTSTVLDVGCGPGTLTTDIAALMPDGFVLGVDVAAGVVAEAQRHARAKGVRNVAFAAADIFRMGVRAGVQFDVVHTHQVLHHVSDPVGALRAMGALTRPGGIVAAREIDYPSMVWDPPSAALDQWLEIYLAVAARNRGHPDAGRLLPRWAAAAGFRDVTYTTSTWTFATAEERAWWGGLWAERMSSTAIADQALSYGVATRADLDAVAEGWLRWSREPVGVFALLHGEVLATH